MKVALLLQAAAVALSKVVDNEAMISDLWRNKLVFFVHILPLRADAGVQLIYAPIGIALVQHSCIYVSQMISFGCGGSRWWGSSVEMSTGGEDTTLEMVTMLALLPGLLSSQDTKELAVSDCWGRENIM